MSALRWWAACAVGRNPLARGADRVQGLALAIGLLTMIVAVYPAVLLGQLGFATRSDAIAAEAATRHQVAATALEDSTAQPSQTESTTTAFLAHVRWTAPNGVHDTMTQVEQPVKAGEQVRIWLNDDGKATTPPPTEADARIVAVGTVVVAWLAIAAVIGAALVGIGAKLGRTRAREWDRGLRELVDNGGGSATHRP